MNGTSCIAPGATTPDDLLAWADDGASSAIVDHVAACPSCHSQALEYRAMLAALTHRLHRADCPDVQVLIDYASDLLPPEDRSATAAHLTICGRCAAELAELRDDLAEPAVGVAERAPVLERLRTVIAALVPSTTPVPGAALVRGETATGGERATYAVENLQIDIAMERAYDRRVTVQGMVLSLDHGAEALARSKADLLLGETIVATTGLDELGQFTLADLPEGTYSLQVSLPDRAIIIPALACDIED